MIAPPDTFPTMSTGIDAAEERRLVQALRGGDEDAFRTLIRTYGPSMLRIAQTFVSTRSVAEEVVQETWLGVLQGLDRFEGRSSLKTWIFRILTNTAKTRGQRESRTVPFTSLAPHDAGDEPAVEPERFLDASHPQWPGHWASFPARWDSLPESRLLGAEARAVIDRAIEGLPAAQRQVLVLRDVHGLDSDEVCTVLSLSEVNQRVLLHRARSKVRAALERYLEPHTA